MPPLRRGVLLAALALVAAQPAGAHAIHTTLTEWTVDDGGVTLRIRAFADDFAVSVARHAGRAAPRDSSAPVPDVVRYVRARFSVTMGGAPVVLQPCGMRRAAELYWLCFRIERPAALPLVIRNQMLTELHADQVNIVQVASGRSRRTLLFTGSSRPAPLP
ncbi:MAG: hypothetical protein IT355_01130 [Gemmatimonadaceae bacterium]|nr:hypothetical protein [Gemmatimonadaceae bacterium]